jgi:O-antigen/teichoic acid export membrane protein
MVYMNTLQKITKNISLVFVSQIISFILGFFTVIYTARYLGADGFGIISLALSLSAIFGVFVDMGLNTLMIREIARDRTLSHKFISNNAIIKVFLSILTFGMLALAVNIIGYNLLVSNIIYLITLSVIITSFSGVFTAIFQANEKMEYLSVTNIISSFILLSGILLGIYFGFNILYFAYVYVVSSMVVFILSLIIYLLKFSKIKLEIDLRFWTPTLKEAWPFGVIFLSGMLYTYVDSIMLSILKGTLAVGWYSAVYRLMYIALILPTAINIAVFPVMSRLYSDSSKESLTLLYERYFKYMIIIGIPIGFATTLLAKDIILFLYGPGFAESVIVLQILVWAIVFTFAGAAYNQLLQSTNKQLIITKISLVCLVINIILNLILIPGYSYIGASIATFITEVILVAYIIFITYKLGYGISYKVVFTDIIKVLIATSIMSLFIWYFNNINFIILVFIAAIIYFIILYFVNGIDEVDMDLLKDIGNIRK